VGSGSSPLSCGVFLPPPLSQAFPLLGAGHAPLLPPSLARPSLFIFQFQEGFPSPALQCSGCPTLFATCLYFSYCLLLSFSFFPGWGSVFPGGYADLTQGCLWKYHVPLSLPCPCLPKQSGCQSLAAAQGALVISPFNMKWRCSAQSGGVEGSKFCLFSVGLPTRCVSSVSPRFHFRRRAFCFLPLATIFGGVKDTDFYKLILYPATLLKLFMVSMSFLAEFSNSFR
jgi:hypothetical protein